MIEAVFALKDDWAEILDFAEKLVISLSRSLQKCEKYRALTEVAQQLYPLATAFKLGLTPEGKLIQLKFSEAKKILRDSIGIQSASDEEDLTYGTLPSDPSLLFCPINPLRLLLLCI